MIVGKSYQNGRLMSFMSGYTSQDPDVGHPEYLYKGPSGSAWVLRNMWCKENLIGEFRMDLTKIYFELEEDKTMFILRWIDK